MYFNMCFIGSLVGSSLWYFWLNMPDANAYSFYIIVSFITSHLERRIHPILPLLISLSPILIYPIYDCQLDVSMNMLDILNSKYLEIRVSSLGKIGILEICESG